MITLLCFMFTPSAADQLNEINSPILQYVQVFLGLGGVLALAYVTLRFGLPRFFGMRPQENGPIRLIARFALEPKKSLYLVKTGSQVFLVATAENQVTYLTDIAPENAAEILAATARVEAPRKDFRQVLALLHKRGEN